MKRLSAIILFGIIGGVLFTTATTAHSAAYPLSLESLTVTIKSLLTARNSIVSRHQSAKLSGMSNPADQDDLYTFVSYLDGRIYYYCEQLFTRGGISALRDTGCPTNADGTLATSQYRSTPVTTIKTDEEKLADLDDAFTQSLGSFDEMLLKEQEKVASHVPREREPQNGSGKDRFETANSTGSRGKAPSENSRSYPSQKGSTSSEENGKQQSGSSPQTDSGSNRGSGTGSTNQSTLPPTSGNKDLSETDDDIIAKQLKEAAEQETDPEVKARLWEEYRKYKEGIR